MHTHLAYVSIWMTSSTVQDYSFRKVTENETKFGKQFDWNKGEKKGVGDIQFNVARK